MEDVEILIDRSVAIIIPAENFTGNRYTFFMVNDSQLSEISNMFKVSVVEGVVEELEEEPVVVINKPVKWVEKVKLDSVQENIPINITKHAKNISIKKIINNEKSIINKIRIS